MDSPSTERAEIGRSEANSLGPDARENLVYYLVMIKVNIHEAKTHLSRLLKQARGGERVVICDRNQPVAELKPIEPEEFVPRVFGTEKGKIVIHPSFFDPLTEEELRLYEGGQDPK
jgi:prevent-host-death family protein